MPCTLILHLCYCIVLPVSTRRALTFANLVSKGASLIQEIQDYEEEVEATRRAAAEAAETAKRRSAAEPEIAPEIEDEVPLSMSREFWRFYQLAFGPALLPWLCPASLRSVPKPTVLLDCSQAGNKGKRRSKARVPGHLAGFVDLDVGLSGLADMPLSGRRTPGAPSARKASSLARVGSERLDARYACVVIDLSLCV